MKYTLRAYSVWEQGPREKQEDSMYPEHGKIVDTDRLFILCDGMGGHSAGEIASSTVCVAMSHYILSHNSDLEGDFSDNDFRAALNAAYDALDEKNNGAAKKMGTTLAFLKLHHAGCTIAHIGDSRVYHIRPGKNAADTEILFQTEDHSLVNDLVKIGELTREEAKYSKQKNVITRAMQPCMERRPKADLYHSRDIMPGDYFMLCSDGILEQMEDENLKFIFSAKGGDASNKIDILIKATAHNHDNHSAIVIQVVDVERSELDTDINPNASMLQEVEAMEDKQGIHGDRVDVRNIDQVSLSRDSVQTGYKTPCPVCRLIKNIIYCLVCAIVAFGGFYLYKTLKNRNESIKYENTPPPTQKNNTLKHRKPAPPSATAPRQRKERSENVDTPTEFSTEESTSPEPMELISAPAPIPIPKNINNADKNDILSSDEQIVNDASKKL